MALKGDLQSVDLAQVFQMLALNKKVGILCIQAPRAWKALYFDHRGATLYYNEHVLLDRVLQQMTRSSRLDDSELAEAREHAIQHGVGLVDSLVAGGYLDEEILQDTISQEMEEEIYDLFFWRDATFEFYEGAMSVEGREGKVDESCFFSTDSLIMEAARRIDEWSFIRERVPGPLEIFYPSANASDLIDADDTTLAVFDVLDGKRNVARVVEITGLPSFTVYKALAVLLDSEGLEPLPPEDMIAVAEECSQERRWQDAINAYEQAINCEIGLPDAHLAVADIYTHQHEYELAGYHRKCYAEFAASEDHIKEAVEILQLVIDTLPTDLQARERLVELTVGRTDMASKTLDPVAAGKELVDLYLEIGEVERVRGILERLLRDNPYDLELKKSLVNVHTKANDTRRVIELYESMAEDLVDHGEPIEAVKYLHKILHLDRDRKDVLEQIRSLYELDERRRNRRRSLVVLGAIFCVLSAAGVVWYFYEQHARETLGSVETKVAGLLEQSNYLGAESEYQRFIDKFPLTIVAGQARSDLKGIQQRRTAHESKLDAERREREKQLAQKRAAYKADWKQVAGSLSTQGVDADLPAIIDMMESIKKRVEENGQIEDIHWAQSVNLESEIRALNEAMRSAVDLERQSRTALAEGRWREARALTLQLIKEYPVTPYARVVKLPVLVSSRPAGADVFFRGQRLVDENEQPLRTPTVLTLPRTDEEVLFELKLDGFESERVTLKPLEVESVERVLTVVPFLGARFPGRVIGPVIPEPSGKALVAAVEGGRVSVVDRDSGRHVRTIDLPGLDEPVQVPVVVGSRLFLATGNGHLWCWNVGNGQRLWRARTRDPAAWPLLVHRDRVMLGDDNGRLIGFDASNGRKLWATPVEGDVVGAPVATDGRGVIVATANGRLLLLDSANGRVARVLEAVESIDSPIYAAVDGSTSKLLFGANGGDLVLYDCVRRQVTWRRQSAAR